ncbi:MAG: potassium channel family protein [Nanoarchaeota archaeon]|nr:potassium channel family protein [Nanoarchaeota archaeon]
MMEKRGFRDDEKEEITLAKLVYYNVMFFVPLITCFFIAKFIGSKLSSSLEASPYIVARILMIFFTLLVFLFIIPYIRKRENVAGIRYALIGFLIVGIAMAVPSIMKGDYSVILNNLIYIAGYILLTFIYCPEVLGIDQDIHKYFERSKQLIVILVYMSIVLLYVLGLSHIHYSIYLENNQAYNFDHPEQPKLRTFAYYSMITFSTIGYGDITPVSAAARFLTTTQAMLGMIINVIFIAILFLYISNIQSWMKKEETEIKKEERVVRRLEKEVEGKTRRKKK